MPRVFNKLYNYRTMAAISQTHNEIKTFIFLDTETTGLPFYENNTTKITELCLTAVQSTHLRLGVFPRVQNKLNLCFNPGKLISYEAEKITGLSNHLLEDSCKFSKETVASINNFLRHSPHPVCFVAHNGLKFDYPLLRSEINKTDTPLIDNILCIDSLILFREVLPAIESASRIESENTNSTDTVDNAQKGVPLEFTPIYDQLLFSCDAQQRNETTPVKQIIREHNYPLAEASKVATVRKSLNFGGAIYKLGDIFSRLTKQDPINSHQADGDVQMLIMCAASLGDKFVDWSNNHAQKFCEIPAMVSGKRIGT